MLVFYVFGPALVVSNLADAITFDSLVTLWFMPVNILITFIIGSALAWLLNKIARTPKHLRGLVIGCCSAGNLGNLLLIIVPAVCDETNSPFGDSTTCSTNGKAYASLSMAVGAIYIWSYVYTIMRISANQSMEEIKSTISTNRSGETSEFFPESCMEAPPSSRDCPSLDDHSHQVPFFKKISQCVVKFTRDINLKKLFAPSTIAAIFGFIIGVVSPIRKVMIGESAPLRVLYSSASLLGEAAIPSMTLIVGSNLLHGLMNKSVGLFLIVGVIAVRYIALPLFGIGVFKAARHFGLLGSDSLYQFVLLLQYALPPAMSAGTISQLLGAGEGECSVIMLWTYALASLSLTLWSTFFMWLVA